MKRAQVQAAVDEAFADGVKHLFSVLVLGSDEPEAALTRFCAGIAEHQDAHDKATAAVERIFPD